ncbi:hypothetical protein FDJ57_gp74 [Gordonia phage Sour]|uniref:Uncharacterized protein n=1 Tax=Gordonia phage Sour TaxID=2182349 RepID=A0A2U8UKW7_9CAUD|nr:hypothetical protein FDJ57_gp74 [Gordonia phage Sour]AWN04275.1 hypothetical protein PBI_SOUR_74 [Gordonia phage Sour]
MGHELDITNGVVSYADSRTDAWHQLGQQVGHLMTPDEALEAANMKGWNVRKEPLLAQVGDELIPIEGKFATVRDNPVTGQVETLGVVGNWWAAFQNEETTDLLGEIVDEGGAHIETIGALHGGRQTFVTMKMPDAVEIESPVTGKIDTTEMYLAILNSHDGQGALRAIATPVRIVCANTQRMAENAARSSVSIHHTGTPSARLAEVRRALGMTFKVHDTYADTMIRWAEVELTDAQVLDAFSKIVAADKAETERQRAGRVETASKVMEIYRSSATVDDFRGTAFGAYNALTEYADHFMPVRGKANAADARALRTLTSANLADLKVTAFSQFAALAS